MPEVMVSEKYRGNEEPFSDSLFVSQLLELGRNGEQPRAAPEDPEEVSLLASVFQLCAGYVQAWFHRSSYRFPPYPQPAFFTKLGHAPVLQGLSGPRKSSGLRLSPCVRSFL